MGKKKLEFLILAFFLVLTRAWDIITTYTVTPDLKTETNPLVSILGRGWVSVIISQIILVSIVIVLNHQSLFRIKSIYPSQKGYSYKKFMMHYYFGKKENLIKIIYKLPQDKRTLIRLLGYVLPRALIVISIFISASSTFLIMSRDYKRFYAVARPYYYIVLIATAFLFIILFFKREYKIYQKILADR
jgi:hypothetical protein